MHKLIAVLFCVFPLAGFVLAQDSAPTGSVAATITVGDGSALVFKPGSNALLVLDGDELQLYEINAGSAQDVASYEFERTPAALAAGAEFALVPVNTGGSTDTLWVMAQDAFARGGYAPVNLLEIPAETRNIVVSPNGRWALAYGDTGFVILQLIAADNIVTSATFGSADTPIAAAALTDDRALVAARGGNLIETIEARSAISGQAASADSLSLNDTPSALAVSPDGDVAAAAVNRQLVLFNPTTLQQLGAVALDDGPVEQMVFSSARGQRYLGLQIANRQAVMLFNVTDPANPSLPGSVGLPGSIQALAGTGGVFAASTGRQISLIQVSPS